MQRHLKMASNPAIHTCLRSCLYIRTRLLLLEAGAKFEMRVIVELLERGFLRGREKGHVLCTVCI
jgi:hypothetical protein